MINKQNLWFLTLFSLILVLSVYYITMPSELLLTNNSNYEQTSNSSSTNVVNVEESNLLTAMRVSLDEERMEARNSLQETLTNTDSSLEDKNKAYEELKYLNELKGKEESLESKIKTTYNLDNFIKIDNNEIKVVVIAKEHSNELANNIMRSIQEEFTDKVYITVHFEK